jgi:hypothetical protein
MVATVLPKSIARSDSTLHSPALECAHPFIPSRPGTFAKFRVAATGATNVSSIYEYRALDAHADADALAVRWQLSVRDERKATPARTFQEMRRCYANRTAEDPWSGYLMGVAAREQTGERWRWPTALHRGDHFGGEFAVHPGRGPIAQLGFARTHEVGARERVDVPAGQFDAWTVHVRERVRAGTTEDQIEGTLWMTERVGLVRAVLRSPKLTLEQQLLEYRSDAS